MMEDDILLAFRGFVESKPNTDFAQYFVLSLIEEIVRLRVKYEGLIDRRD